MEAGEQVVLTDLATARTAGARMDPKTGMEDFASLGAGAPRTTDAESRVDGLTACSRR